MTYQHFDETVPDAATQGIVAIGDATRKNLVAIRDDVLCGEVPDWSVTPVYDGADPYRITSITAAKGTERLRRTYLYATAGADAGRLVRVDTDFSADSGGSWMARSSTTISYNANGTISLRAQT